MVHHWPKELLIWHCTGLCLGQMARLIMIILSLTPFMQDVFPMVHTLTIAEPIWPMLQNISKLTDNILHEICKQKCVLDGK